MPRTRREKSPRTRGAYMTRTLLPGESAEEFEALHAQLVAEYEPDGVLEADAVRAIARCLWRKGRLDGLKRAPRPTTMSFEYIMDPRHSRYVPGKWTYAVKRGNMPGAPPPPPYVPSYTDLESEFPPPPAPMGDGADDPADDDERPTLDGMLEEFDVEANFDLLIRRHVLALWRLKGLKHAVKSARRAIDVTPRPMEALGPSKRPRLASGGRDSEN